MERECVCVRVCSFQPCSLFSFHIPALLSLQGQWISVTAPIPVPSFWTLTTDCLPMCETPSCLCFSHTHYICPATINLILFFPLLVPNQQKLFSFTFLFLLQLCLISAHCAFSCCINFSVNVCLHLSLQSQVCVSCQRPCPSLSSVTGELARLSGISLQIKSQR